MADRALDAAKDACEAFVATYDGTGRKVPLEAIATTAVDAARPIIEAEVMERANLVNVDLRKLREALAEVRQGKS